MVVQQHLGHCISSSMFETYGTCSSYESVSYKRNCHIAGIACTVPVSNVEDLVLHQWPAAIKVYATRDVITWLAKLALLLCQSFKFV